MDYFKDTLAERGWGQEQGKLDGSVVMKAMDEVQDVGLGIWGRLLVLFKASWCYQTEQACFKLQLSVFYIHRGARIACIEFAGMNNSLNSSLM